jgi:hypothetical protein
MDFSFLDGIIDSISQSIGLQGAELLAALAVLSIVCQYLGKLIPDDKTGILGILRMVLKTIGLYTSNRITAGVSTTDIARVVADSTQKVRDPETGKFGSASVADIARGL